MSDSGDAFIYSFSKYLLGTHYVLLPQGKHLGGEDERTNEILLGSKACYEEERRRGRKGSI